MYFHSNYQPLQNSQRKKSPHHSLEYGLNNPNVGDTHDGKNGMDGSQIYHPHIAALHPQQYQRQFYQAQQLQHLYGTMSSSSQSRQQPNQTDLAQEIVGVGNGKNSPNEDRDNSPATPIASTSPEANQMKTVAILTIANNTSQLFQT